MLHQMDGSAHIVSPSDLSDSLTVPGGNRVSLSSTTPQPMLELPRYRRYRRSSGSEGVVVGGEPAMSACASGYRATCRSPSCRGRLGWELSSGRHSPEAGQSRCPLARKGNGEANDYCKTAVCEEGPQKRAEQENKTLSSSCIASNSSNEGEN